MAWDDEEDTTTYKIVINHEEQYSLWPADKKNPSGWRDVGKQGEKQEMMRYIDKKWPGMQPLRLLK